VQAMPDAVSSRFSSLDVWYLQDSLSRRERVARLRRVRGARPTILQIDETVGRAALIRRCAPPSPKGRRIGFPIWDSCASKEGIKIQPYSGSSPTINVGQQPPSAVAKFLRRYAAHLNHVAVWIAELRRARHVRRFDLRPGAFELLDCGLVIE
jgi:hypothetical protein